jgi:hypothetical protein
LIRFKQNLLDREAEMIAKNMLELILAGVRTPERPASPENAYLTDEQIFTNLNPSVSFLSYNNFKKQYSWFSSFMITNQLNNLKLYMEHFILKKSVFIIVGICQSTHLKK